MKRILFSIAAFSTLSLFLFGCALEVRESDDGNHAWARQVVPVLYGRQPRGEVEVRVVADLARAVGRRSAVERMMNKREFVDYWSDVMFDIYRAPREGAKSLSDCVGQLTPNRIVDAALATWIKDNPPTVAAGAPGGRFNLADLLASSIKLDNLSPFIRGQFLAMNSKPITGNEIVEENQRQDFYTNFESTFLGRNSDCLICHNAAWSTTDKFSGWNRSHSIIGYFERSMFGNHTGLDNPEQGHALFRVGGVVTGANRNPPWGMDDCGEFKQPQSNDRILEASGVEAFLAGDQGLRASVFTTERILANGINDLNGMSRSVSASDVAACDVCETFCAGNESPPVLDQVQIDQEAAAHSIIEDNCLSCHAEGEFASGFLLLSEDESLWKNQLLRVQSGRGSPKARIHPGDAGSSFLVDAITDRQGNNPNGNYPMPLFSVPRQDAIDTISAWINNMPERSGCDTCRENNRLSSCPAPAATVPGDESFAFLVAMNLTDRVWKEVMGYPLTIAHGYSRNIEQRNLHWHLTEVQFIANDWSLKRLLGFILSSDYFNRKPPQDGDGKPVPSGGTTPYEMPMFFDPWVERDPREPPMVVANGDPDPDYSELDNPSVHFNAMTEAIHRKSAKALLRSASYALDWSLPRRVPNASFPSRDLAVNIGQFEKDSVPGFNSENLSSFMEWETKVASCQSRSPNDWISRVSSRIQTHNVNNANSKITVIQAAVIVKDWLLSNGSMTNDEKQVVAAVMGAGENEATDSLENLETSLRDYCGVLIDTPQFKLLGLTSDDIGPAPRLRICNDGPCSYREICEYYIPPRGGFIIGAANIRRPQCRNSSISSTLVVDRT